MTKDKGAPTHHYKVIQVNIVVPAKASSERIHRHIKKFCEPSKHDRNNPFIDWEYETSPNEAPVVSFHEPATGVEVFDELRAHQFWDQTSDWNPPESD